MRWHSLMNERAGFRPARLFLQLLKTKLRGRRFPEGGVVRRASEINGKPKMRGVSGKRRLRSFVLLLIIP